jgi:hypothetical protein
MIKRCVLEKRYEEYHIFDVLDNFSFLLLDDTNCVMKEWDGWYATIINKIHNKEPLEKTRIHKDIILEY